MIGRKQKRSAGKYTKGDPILFFDGQYEGKFGWVQKRQHVYLFRDSAKHHPDKARNFVEAVFIQKSDAEKL
eukprot:7816929-Ditylum_brightwellii.AAC.1